MKTNRIIIILIVIGIYYNTSAQIAINSDGTKADSSAILHVKSTTKGLLIPRMTFDERNAIIDPAEGLMVICTDCGDHGSLSIFSNNAWNTFTPCSVGTPSQAIHTATQGLINWHWDSVPGASGYKAWYTHRYDSAIEFGNTLNTIEAISTCDTSYVRFLWAYNDCAVSEPCSLTITLPPAPDPPLEGTHVADTTAILWKWNIVANAEGYKWNTTNDSSTAIDLGTDTCYNEISLSCDSTYNRFVWAYNVCGISNPDTLRDSTLNCLHICGDLLYVNHIAGNVVPVSKQVTYGTVSNIPGEPSKCWITSNLGADHQADSVSDTTQASAGWYWQFNKKQGFTHDGISRLPNSIWQTPLNQYYNWTLASDPCSLELGVEWRIPTLSEWSNIEVAGNWTDWSGPWNSSLKLHAAGKLVHSTGNLEMRGSSGQYWSNTHIQGTDAWVIYLDLSLCHTSFHEQANGFTIRCIKD